MINLNTQYPYEPDVNLVALDLFKTLKNPLNVLDVGCGFGMLAKVIKKDFANLNIVGIESHPSLVQEDVPHLDLIKLDLMDFILVEKALGEKKFDCIIFSDVLEHVYDPCSILLFYKRYLTKNGKILISVPNVANIYSRLNLLIGNFDYQETGVMDKTHIRFFTVKSLFLLAREASLRVVSFSNDSIIVRWHVPLIKKILAARSARYKKSNEKISESKEFVFYSDKIRPLENFIAKLMPNIFAFRLCILCDLG